MTPGFQGFQAALRRLEGQWRNLFRRIRRIRRSAAIPVLSGSFPESGFFVIYPPETRQEALKVSGR